MSGEAVRALQPAGQEQATKKMSTLDTRTLKDELTSMDRKCLVDLGHPLLNRVADSFIRAAGVGAARAVSREAYVVTVEGTGVPRPGRVYLTSERLVLTRPLTIYLQGFQETRPGWTPTAASGAISPASEVTTARGRSTQWCVTNTAQSCDSLCRFINRFYLTPLDNLQVKTAGKEAFQWG